MKKKIILLLIILLTFILKVNATTVNFDLIKDTKDKATLDLKDDLIGTSINISYKDGYIFIIQNTSNTEKIDYYDSNLELKKSVTIENKYIIEGVANQENIYLLAYETNNKTTNFKILKLNEDLEIIKEYSLDGKDLEKINYFEYFDFSKYGMPFMSTVDDKISIMAFDEKNEQEIIIQLDLDLAKHEVVLFDDENLKKYFINFYNMGNFIGKMLQTTGVGRNYVSSDINDNYHVYGSFNTDDLSQINENDSVVTYLTLTNENDEIIFDKSFDALKEYKAIINVKLINDYIVAIGLKNNGDSTDYKREIIVFDLEGNIVQTINTNSLYTDLIAISNGFVVSRNDMVKKESDITYNNYIELYAKNTLQAQAKINNNYMYIIYLIGALLIGYTTIKVLKRK